MKRRAKPKGTSIAGAEKKLRQAEFFWALLEAASKEYQGGIPRGGANDAERLEFYFSACLTATQSVRYVLKATYGPKFEDAEKKWRKGLSNDSRARFDWMIDVRDDDVHFATTGAKPLQKYVKEEPWQTRSPYSFRSHSPLLLGQELMVEEENPDGTKVRGSSLRGAVGLFLDRDGVRVEATVACREFIDRLRSLLEATKAAFSP